jgi:hypothetical protein
VILVKLELRSDTEDCGAVRQRHRRPSSPVSFNPAMALTWAGRSSTLITNGMGAAPDEARRRNSFATIRPRLGDDRNSIVSPADSTTRYRQAHFPPPSRRRGQSTVPVQHDLGANSTLRILTSVSRTFPRLYESAASVHNCAMRFRTGRCATCKTELQFSPPVKDDIIFAAEFGNLQATCPRCGVLVLSPDQQLTIANWIWRHGSAVPRGSAATSRQQ